MSLEQSEFKLLKWQQFTVDFQSSLEIDLVTLVKIINGLQFLGGIYTGEPVLFLLSIFVLKIGRTTFNLPIICMSKLVWPFNFDLITLIPIWFIYFLQGVSCLISAQLEIWHHLIYQPTKTAYCMLWINDFPFTRAKSFLQVGYFDFVLKLRIWKHVPMTSSVSRSRGHWLEV